MRQFARIVLFFVFRFVKSRIVVFSLWVTVGARLFAVPLYCRDYAETVCVLLLNFGTRCLIPISLIIYLWIYLCWVGIWFLE